MFVCSLTQLTKGGGEEEEEEEEEEEDEEEEEEEEEEITSAHEIRDSKQSRAR